MERRLEGVQRQPYSFGDRGLRPPAELALGSACVERDALNLARAGWGELGLEVLGAVDLGKPGGELEHVGLDPAADVDRSARLRLGCGKCGRNHVPYIYVVAGLLAVAEHGRPSAGAQATAEDRDHARLAERVLARSIDVAQPQAHAGEAVETFVERQVALGGELALAIGREGSDRGALVEWQLLSLALAVDGATGRDEDDAGRVGRSHRLQQVCGAADVDRRVEGRVR